MRTKALLNDDGRLYAKVKVYLTLRNGRKLNGTRVGNSYAPNVASNFSAMINTAVLDATYQVLNDNGLNQGQKSSGDMGNEVSIDYDLKDYWIDYTSSYNKKEDYKYRTGFSGKGKKKEQVVFVYKKIDTPQGTKKNVLLRKEPYVSKGISDIRREEFLYNQDVYARGKRRIRFNNKTYRSPYRKTFTQASDDDVYESQASKRKMYKED